MSKQMILKKTLVILILGLLALVGWPLLVTGAAALFGVGLKYAQALVLCVIVGFFVGLPKFNGVDAALKMYGLHALAVVLGIVLLR